MSWESISLSDALRPLKSSPFTRDELNYSGGQYQNVHYGDILVRFTSVVDAEKEGLPYVSDSAKGRCSRCSLLQNGDIIIADTAEDEAVGKAIEIQGISDQKVVSGLHTMAFRPQEGLFAPGFLGYFLNSSVYHNQLLPLMQGIKVLSISKTAIGDTVIKYPLYKEQEKIVESLSGVDDMIGALDEAITKKRQIKEGLMQQLLTGKTRLPGFSGEWKDWTLGEVASVRSGFPFKSETYSNTGRFSVITIANVQNGYLNLDECNKVDRYPKGLQDFQKLKLGDILISMTGNVGRVCLVSKQNCLLNQRVGFIESKGIISKGFLFALLNSYYFENAMIDKGQGAAQANLSNKDIETYAFPAPKSIEEQDGIARVLQSMDAEIDSYQFQRNKYALIKQGMMQELLTGKTRLI